MRQSKIIRIDDREILVKEVNPAALLTALQSGDVVSGLKTVLADCVEGPGLEALYSSELEQVCQAFLEVNAAFFRIAVMLKADGVIGDILEALKAQFKTSLPALFAASFGTATEQSSGTSAGASS